MEIVVTLIVAGLLGLIPAKIAQSKGYAFGKWWIYGFLLFIVAIIHACVLKPNAASSALNEGGNAGNTPPESTKKCPYCTETIKADAKICRFCGKELETDTKNTQADIKNSNSESAAPNSSFNESSTNATPVESKENSVKGIIIAIIYIMLLWPLRFFESFFYTLANMDSGTWFAKFFGYKPKKCRYCDHYFSSLRHIGYACKNSPTGKHRE